MVASDSPENLQAPATEKKVAAKGVVKKAGAATASKESPMVGTMGDELTTLVRMRLGLEEHSYGRLQEIKEKALALRQGVTKAMGREHFALEELEKKDIVLRQQYERAFLLLSGIEHLEKHNVARGKRKDWWFEFWKQRRAETLAG